MQTHTDEKKSAGNPYLNGVRLLAGIALLTVTAHAAGDATSDPVLAVIKDMAKDGAKASALAGLKDLAVLTGILDDPDKNYNALTQQLDGVAAGLQWAIQDNYISSSWALGRDAVLEMEKDPAVRDTNKADSESRLACLQMAYSQNSYRRTINSSDRDFIKSVGLTTSALYLSNGNLIYDYRYGIPVFLELIGWRLKIIRTLNPSFVNNQNASVRDELTQYLTALTTHYDRMVHGIYTGSVGVGSCPYLLGCSDTRHFVADIFSHAQVLAWFDSSPNYSKTPEERYAAAERDLRGSLPLFELKSVINLLYRYTHNPRQDFTEATHEIMSYTSPSLCLEAHRVGQTGPADLFVFDARLATCNGGSAQKWQYDRTSGIIRNMNVVPSSSTGVCLGIGSSTDHNDGSLAARNALPLSIGKCTSDKWQQWTYDPATRALLSAMGTVLDVKWDVLQSGTPVWSWPLNGGTAQVWDDIPTVIVY